MNNDTVIEEFVSECDDYYKTKTSKSMTQAGLSPISIITAILAIIVQMCPKSASELKAEATTGGARVAMLCASATRVALREQYPGQIFVYAKYNGDAIAESVRKTLAAKDEEQIQMGLNYVAN